MCLFFLMMFLQLDPTGVQNNLNELRSMIQDMELNNDVLYIPPGTYRIEATQADLDGGAYFLQRGNWNIITEGRDRTFFDIYPKIPTFNSDFIKPNTQFNTDISGISFIGGDTEYDPRTQPWLNAIYIVQGSKSNPGRRLNINDCDFLGIWTYGISKSGGSGDEYHMTLNRLVFDRTLGSAISAFAGDTQHVYLNSEDVHIKNAGLPGWNHGVYIHPHISIHLNRYRIDNASTYAIKYYSSGGNQTVKPKYAIIENSYFENSQCAIAYDGPELITLKSRNNTFHCTAFYYGSSIISENDLFEYPTLSQACIVGGNLNGATWKFINPRGINAKFRIASNSTLAANNTIIFEGAVFKNSYIEQTHGTPNHDQSVIIRNLTSFNNDSIYLFRPLCGYWQIENIWVVGTFNSAPFAAPILTDYGANITRYSINNGYIRINKPAIVNRSGNPNPLVLTNVDID